MQRVNVDLTTARVAPTAFPITNAKRIRFHVVPAPFQVRLQSSSADPIPVNEPFTLENCSANPWTKIYIENVASSGSAVVLATDGSEDFDDFLANGVTGLITGTPFLFTESYLWHAFVHPNSTNPQELITTKGDAATYQVSAGGLAGQNFANPPVYYGGLFTPQAANAAALGGGTVTFNPGRMGNLDVIINALSTTVPTFTRGLTALNRAGAWFFETDALLESVVINVAGTMFAAPVAMGWNPGDVTAASGIGGGRGFAILWSNGLPNNNYWLVFGDGTNITASADTGVPAIGSHTHCRLEYGVLGTQAFYRAVIDGQVRATLTTIGTTFATVTGFAAAVIFPRSSAAKIQAGQATNNVILRCGGYDGWSGGRFA